MGRGSPGWNRSRTVHPRCCTISLVKRTRASTRANLTALLYRLRTEADTPVLQSVSIGVGVAIGCLPVYGLHLPLCLALGRVLGLNRITMALAANVNNPFVGPLLVLAEIQVGSLVRRGRFYDLTLANLHSYSLLDGLGDIVLGSLVVGVVLGSVLGAVALGVLRQNAHDRARKLLTERVAYRYLAAGYLRWERARASLRRDPVYLELATSGFLPRRGLLVQVGCGHGALLALLDTYRTDGDLREKRPADWADPPELELAGVEERRRAAAVARKVLAPSVQVRRAAIRSVELPRCAAVVLVDVLVGLDREQQEDLLDRVARALEPGGRLAVREPGAGQWWRGCTRRVAGWLRRRAAGRGQGTWCVRTAEEWCALLADRGFDVRSSQSRKGTFLVCVGPGGEEDMERDNPPTGRLAGASSP